MLKICTMVKDLKLYGRIIQDISKPDLWFSFIIYCPIIIHIPTKFHENISKGYGIME